MTGLQRICKQYGSMKIQGVTYVWDYANSEAVKESDMPIKSERWRESEKVKFAQQRRALFK